MKISVIIPIYNDDKMLQNILREISNLKEIDEVIVVKAVDDFKENYILKKFLYIPYTLIISKKGRAVQMNLGAEFAKNEILWFLHSDSKLTNYKIDKEIKNQIENKNIKCGGLKIKFSPNSPLLSLIAYLSNLRAKIFKICFGDQSIFITKKLFNDIKGFREIAIMEDLQLFMDIKKHNESLNTKYFKLLNSKIISSSRRFTKNGTLKTIFKMHKLKYLYFKGTNTDSLNKIYENMKKR